MITYLFHFFLDCRLLIIKIVPMGVHGDIRMCNLKSLILIHSRADVELWADDRPPRTLTVRRLRITEPG